MALKRCAKFSDGGDYFACCGVDGTLRVFDVADGSLKQQFTPSSHLSSCFTCLSWERFASNNHSPKKKRLKVSDSIHSLQLIALGTADGSVLLYSVTKGELHTKLSDGHSQAVTDLCWSVGGDRLFSCSKDKEVVEWDVQHSKITRKWKGDKGSLSSLSMCHTGKHLLTSSRKIKLWDLDTLEVAQVFTGHSSEVIQLLSVPCPKCLQNHSEGSGSKCQGEIEGAYFLSAAADDRVLNAWQISSEKRERQALASFSLTDEPLQINFSPPTKNFQTCLISVVTRRGQLLIFEHQLNGRCRQPVQSKVRLQVVTSGQRNSDDVPSPIPVMCSHVLSDDQRTILVAHSSTLKPVFEKIAYKDSKPEICLVREDPSISVIQKETNVSKVKTPVVPNDVTVLAPGHSVTRTQIPTDSVSDGLERTPRKRKQSAELSMEERLHAMRIEKPSASQQRAQLVDSMATLLGQGLQSGDKKILNQVLQRKNEKIITSTVRSLPISAVVPLLQTLAERLDGPAQSCLAYIRWTKAVLTLHAAYLASFPDLVKTVQTLRQVMSVRCEMLERLTQLQGKLDLVLSQATMQEEGDDEIAGQEAVLDYQDESDDDGMVMEDLLDEDSEAENMVLHESSDMEVPDQSDSDDD